MRQHLSADIKIWQSCTVCCAEVKVPDLLHSSGPLMTSTTKASEGPHLASATLMRQPPEKVFVARRCMSASNERPASIRAALASAA